MNQHWFNDCGIRKAGALPVGLLKLKCPLASVIGYRDTQLQHVQVGANLNLESWRKGAKV